MTTAAGIIIGEEILSGKVKDENVLLLIQTLRQAGVSLRRIATIGDTPEDIAEEVSRCAERYHYVITSGGLGPTHDDRTMEGIAQAFGAPVVRHPYLVQLVENHFRGRITEAALKMAEIPEGARLLTGEDNLFPVVIFRNIYILPGVPQLFAAKLERVRQELTGTRVTLDSIYLRSDESSIAAALSQAAAEHPEVAIGSYPRLGDPDYRVRVTIEGADPSAVSQVRKRLEELLPAEQIVPPPLCNS